MGSKVEYRAILQSTVQQSNSENTPLTGPEYKTISYGTVQYS